MHKPEQSIQRVKQSSLTESLSTVIALISLTKPIAVTMIIVVTAVGFALAVITQGSLFSTQDTLVKLLLTSLLVACSSGGAFALNQYNERHLDAKMHRVRDRALPSGKISPLPALFFGLSLFIIPVLALSILVTPECAVLTFLCGALYVWAYTPLKTRSTMSTFVGALPGALLPLIGWTAVRESINLTILYPTALLFIWQIPHALVIALKYIDDYSRAGMKQLPVVAGAEAGYRAVFFSTFLTGILAFLPVFWTTSYIVFSLITFFLFISGIILAAHMWAHKKPQDITLYFSYNLISLPLYLVLFIVTL